MRILATMGATLEHEEEALAIPRRTVPNQQEKTIV
jgi:hypothetical protein